MSIITEDRLSPKTQYEKYKVDTSHCSGMEETEMKYTTLHAETKTLTVVGADYTYRIYNKMLDRDQSSVCLFDTKLKGDHMGVQLQLSTLNFL